MPTYNFVHEETGETSTEFLWISELDQYLADNPKLIVVPPDTSAQVDSIRMGRTKTPESFREFLRNVKSYYRGSTIEV